MPKLPTAEQLGQRPAPRPRGGIAQLQLSTPQMGHEEAALANMGQAVQGLGQVLTQLAIKEKNELDAAKVEEATNTYSDNLFEFEYGEKDGFTNILTGDAVKKPMLEDYRKKREEATKKIRDTLGTKEQQVAFDQRASIADRQFDGRLYRHIAEQSRNYQNVVYQGTLDTERRNASLNWNQPGQIELSVLRTNQEVLRKARLDGLDPSREDDAKVIASMQNIAETQIHADVVQQMLVSGKDMAAGAYYNQVKDRLTPEAIVTLGSKVDSASVDGQAMRNADQTWELLGPKGLDDPVRLDVMERFVKEQSGEDPRLAKEAISQLRSMAVAHNDAQQEVTASNKSKVLSAFHDGADLKTLQTMPEYQMLDGAQRDDLKEYVVNSGWTQQQRARAQREYIEGDKSRAGFRAYWELSTPSVLSVLSEQQILALEPSLGQALTEDLLVKRRALDSPSKILEANIDVEQFNTLAADAGLKPYDKGMSPEQKEQLGRLRNHVESVIDIEQRGVGHKLNREERGKIIQKEMDKKVMVDEWGRDPSMPAAVVKPAMRKDVYVQIKDADPRWVNEAINYMRSTGKVPQEWSNDTARLRMKSRLEHAYAVSITGGSTAEVNAILENTE